VNGDITMPVPAATGAPTAEEKVTIREWRKRDNQVADWLLATMEPHIVKIMTYQGTAQAMWEKAKKMYGKKKNYSYIYQLQQEIQQIKQQPNQSVSEMFSLLQEKSDELKLYRPLTSDLKEIQLREEQDEVFRFLASLDPSYETVRSQLLLQPELPSLDDVMGRIEGEETMRLVMDPQPIIDQEAKAFATAFRNHNPKSEMRGAQIVWCEHCKLKGHKKDDC
jgi:gag-polypeptide of LTR copia-type